MGERRLDHLLTGHLLSEWATKCSRGAEYTCGTSVVGDLGLIDVTIVRAEAMKQSTFSEVT